MEIKRDHYLEQLKRKAGNGKIKVITGLKRSGKSYLLNNIYRDYLIANGVAPESIISFSLNKKKDAKYRSPIKLGEEIEHIRVPKEEVDRHLPLLSAHYVHISDMTRHGTFHESR